MDRPDTPPTSDSGSKTEEVTVAVGRLREAMSDTASHRRKKELLVSWLSLVTAALATVGSLLGLETTKELTSRSVIIGIGITAITAAVIALIAYGIRKLENRNIDKERVRKQVELAYLGALDSSPLNPDRYNI
jgi:hypothetical protein